MTAWFRPDGREVFPYFVAPWWREPPLEGTDEMGWKPTVACHTPQTAYDAAADVQFFDDAPDTWMDVHAGQFAIFFPPDAHLPMISSGPVHKVVFKVAMVGT